MISLEINGKKKKVDVPEDTPLLWVIREELSLLGTKFGCGKGLCGACTVHLDGKAIRSCVTPVSAAQEKSLSTIEGQLDDPKFNALKKMWHENSVAQCGYCQPGQLMSAMALLNTNESPNSADIDSAMSGNLCRCGTYPRIKATLLAFGGGVEVEEPEPEIEEDNQVKEETPEETPEEPAEETAEETAESEQTDTSEVETDDSAINEQQGSEGDDSIERTENSENPDDPEGTEPTEAKSESSSTEEASTQEAPSEDAPTTDKAKTEGKPTSTEAEKAKPEKATTKGKTQPAEKASPKKDDTKSSAKEKPKDANKSSEKPKAAEKPKSEKKSKDKPKAKEGA